MNYKFSCIIKLKRKILKKIHLLAKIFKKEEHLNDFKNGKLYMNSIAYFKKYKLENDKVRFNTDESLDIHWQAESCSLVLNKHEFNPIGAVKLYFSKNNYKNIFCMFSISSEDNLIKNGIHIDEKNKGFGNYLAVIKNPNLFLERVISGVENSELNIRIGLVNYYDKSTNLTFEENEVGFHKLKDFSYQQEYRIIIDTNIKNTPFILEIGDLSDILEVLSIDEFNKNISFKNNVD